MKVGSFHYFFCLGFRSLQRKKKRWKDHFQIWCVLWRWCPS